MVEFKQDNEMTESPTVIRQADVSTKFLADVYGPGTDAKPKNSKQDNEMTDNPTVVRQRDVSPKFLSDVYGKGKDASAAMQAFPTVEIIGAENGKRK